MQCHVLQLSRLPCPSPNSQSLLKLMSVELVMSSNHLILCRPLLLLPSIFPSIRIFSNELVLGIRWPKYWSFSFNISPSNVHPGLISFKMDWLDLLAVQGTLKGLLQQYSSKASVLWRSVQFSRSVVSDSCNPMDCSTPGFSVQHQLPEFAQTYVHGVSDAIKPSHSLSSPCLPAFNLFQRQGLF